MVETDINKRWEQGLPHHEKSLEIKKIIRKADTDGHWDFGGDGDNGEELLYYLDIYFEQEDEKVNAPWAIHPSPPPPFMYGDCIAQCLECLGFTFENPADPNVTMCQCEEPLWCVEYSRIMKRAKELGRA